MLQINSVTNGHDDFNVISIVARPFDNNMRKHIILGAFFIFEQNMWRKSVLYRPLTKSEQGKLLN